MQNKHQKIFFWLWVSQPPGRGVGGGQAGWSKRPSLSKDLFLGLPSLQCNIARVSACSRLLGQYMELDLICCFHWIVYFLHRVTRWGDESYQLSSPFGSTISTTSYITWSNNVTGRMGSFIHAKWTNCIIQTIWRWTNIYLLHVSISTNSI